MHESVQPQSLTYRSDIDGLRALAVLAVVAYHADFLGFAGGFVGVDVFFVISGFLITQHLSTELQRNGSLQFTRFYAKRVRRLFPALSLTVLVTLVVWMLFFAGIPSETRPFLKSIRYSLFGLANVYFKNNTGGYFDGPSAEMPLLHFWSLAVEEQFYLVWPLLLFCCYRIAKIKGILIGLLLVAVLSFAYSEFLLQNGQTSSAFYGMPSRAWELAIGGCLAFMDLERWFRNRFASLAVSVIGLAMILFSVFSYSVHTVFPGMAAIPAVFGAFLLILGGAQSQPVTQLLSSKAVVKLGVLSYGWYLWHWPLLAFARVYYMGARPPVSVRCLVVGLALLLAEISLNCIERPIRFGKRFLQFGPWQLMFRAFAVAAGICVLAWAITENERSLIPANQRRFLELTEERVSLYADCVDRLENRFGPQCEKTFTHGKPKSEVIVWGDSHGFSYFPMIEAYAQNRQLKIRLVERSGILPLMSETSWMDDSEKTADMKKMNQNALSFIRERALRAEEGKISVVLAARWMQRSGKKPISVLDVPLYLDHEKTETGSVREIENGLRQTIQLLKDAGVDRILTVLPYPEFKYPVLRCHVRRYPDCDTPRAQMDLYRREVVETMKKVVSGYSEVRLLDPVESMCDQNRCPEVMTINGQETPVVFDDDHPSVAAAKLLGEKNRLVLDWLTRNDKEY